MNDLSIYDPELADVEEMIRRLEGWSWSQRWRKFLKNGQASMDLSEASDFVAEAKNLCSQLRIYQPDIKRPRRPEQILQAMEDGRASLDLYLDYARKHWEGLRDEEVKE